MAGSVTQPETQAQQDRHAKRDGKGRFTKRADATQQAAAPAPMTQAALEPRPASETAPAGSPDQQPGTAPRVDPLLTEAIRQSPVKPAARAADPAPGGGGGRPVQPAAAAAPAPLPGAGSSASVRLGRVLIGAGLALGVILAVRAAGVVVRRLQSGGAGGAPAQQAAPQPQDVESQALAELRRRLAERGIDLDAGTA